MTTDNAMLDEIEASGQGEDVDDDLVVVSDSKNDINLVDDDVSSNLQ